MNFLITVSIVLQISVPLSTKKPKNRTSEIHRTVQTSDNMYIGGTAWESNPANLARRSQAVLKTVEDTSTPFSPVLKNKVYYTEKLSFLQESYSNCHKTCLPLTANTIIGRDIRIAWVKGYVSA